MKLTCLGKWGAYPEAGSATSSFLLEESGFRLLIDCGSGVLSQLQRVLPVYELDAVILSHYHHDHIADIGCLQYAMLIQSLLGNRQSPLSIFAHGEDDPSFGQLSYKKYTTARRIQAFLPCRIGPWEVEFCPTVHPAYCLAMKFRGQSGTLVYTADTGWSGELVDFCQGADWIISEASLYNGKNGEAAGHLTAGEAGQMATQAGAKQLILTHLPHYGDHSLLLQQAGERFSGLIDLAEELREWELQ